MSDDIDRADQEIECSIAEAIRCNRKAEIKPGTPGDCEMCGEWSARLVGGACAPCRDKFKLP